MAFDWKFGPGIVSVQLWTDVECNRPPLRLVVGPYSIPVPWLLAQMSSDWRGIDIGSTLGWLRLYWRLVNDCSRIGWFLDCFLDWKSLCRLLLDWQFFRDWHICPGLVLDWHWIGRKMNWVIGHGLGDLRFEIELEYWSELDILAEWQNHAPSRHFGGSL